MMDVMRQYTEMLNSELAKTRFGSHPRELYDPIAYMMQPGGKRMRPILTLLAYGLWHHDAETIVRPSLAVEVFHNFTLMHDDVMDNAPLRRGQPTVHQKWNTNVAILSGDTMLVKAYDFLLEASPDKLQEILRAFNRCATQVCEGQQMDMNFESLTQVSIEQYLEMIRLKTAVLLGFSMELGAMLAGAPTPQAALLRQFGELIGIGFQLKDDLLDVYGNQASFGKQPGGDIVANKKTFLLITALENATGDTLHRLENLLLAKNFDPQEKIADVVAIYNHLGVRQAAEQKMNECFNKALLLLNALSVPHERKQKLSEVAHYLITRQN